MTDLAYVFVYLPGQVVPTVAGRFELNRSPAPAVGRFVYGESYLENSAGLPLVPVALPLRAQQFSTTLNSGLSGVIRDAIPDDWGRHVASKLYGDAFQQPFDFDGCHHRIASVLWPSFAAPRIRSKSDRYCGGRISRTLPI
ncbi:HipA N-terminal domain-containing protein [Steroidobacter sp. S1-65]|uniref:HipA N-terminal domain-containing protein n=1 Tax=Steroidobacter gossypii TaxID=2805490 RepID=A0ABS1WXV6_9GAMM|nr:HipA N-terminal domain-containing protein [Steroidobacter gossypii]MBM0105810.1 HipA N-terminal domain-containing protein [Steroidobacter gossypii]